MCKAAPTHILVSAPLSVGSSSKAQSWVSAPQGGIVGSPGYPGLGLKLLLLFEDAK